METVKNLEEATAHFENSVQPVLCEKEGEQPIEASTLQQARDYYGFTEEAVAPPPPPANDPPLGDPPPVVDAGAEQVVAEPGATNEAAQNEGSGALVD